MPQQSRGIFSLEGSVQLHPRFVKGFWPFHLWSMRRKVDLPDPCGHHVSCLRQFLPSSNDSATEAHLLEDRHRVNRDLGRNTLGPPLCNPLDQEWDDDSLRRASSEQASASRNLSFR